MRRLLIASTATVVLVAGCGSGRLSHAQLLIRADTVCASYNKQVAKLTRPRTVPQVRRYAQRVLPIYRDALDRLSALNPPKQDERAFDVWLASDRRIELDVESLASVSTDAALRAAIAQAGADDARSARLARALGLAVCGMR